MFCHNNLQEYNERKKVISTGITNSAHDKPNQTELSAFPLDLSKYLEITVEEACVIKPCPESRNKNRPINSE